MPITSFRSNFVCPILFVSALLLMSSCGGGGADGDANDTTAPIITLIGNNLQVITTGTAYTELGATAVDDVDGDISGLMTIDANTVDTSTAGSYLVIYNVTDSSGNTANTTRTVTVVDPANEAPVAQITGEQLVASGFTVSLIGSGSDSDGEVVGFSWSQTSGPVVSLASSDQAITSFIAPDVSGAVELSFDLTVTDDDGDTHTASISLQVDALGRYPFPDGISLLPVDWEMPISEQVQFVHKLGGTPATSADWAVNGIVGGNGTVGTINSQGLYTAPTAVPFQNPVMVRATLSGNPAVFSESPVIITDVPVENGFHWQLWTPRVVDASSPTDAVTFEIGFIGYPHLQFSLLDTQQRTNTTAADLNEGRMIKSVALRTGVYASRMSTTEILADHTEGLLIQTVGVLHCDICDINSLNELARDRGMSIVALFNDSTVPSVQVSSIALDVQASSHVVNIAVSVVGTHRDWPLVAAQNFYKYFSDRFDFLVFVNAHRTIGPAVAAGNSVQNAITGIGLGIFDNSAFHGSAGRMQGEVVLWHSNSLDLTDRLFLHEIGHRWMVFLSEPPINSLQIGGHWPANGNFSGGIYAGGHSAIQYDLVSQNVYQVTCPPPEGFEPQYEFSDIELYLMGLLGPEDVSPHIIFDEPTSCNQQGTAIVVTIDDIIATYGARSPDHTESQQNFTLATIVLSKGRLLTPHEMAYFNHTVERGERLDSVPYLRDPNRLRLPFHLATGNRATLSTRVLP